MSYLLSGRRGRSPTAFRFEFESLERRALLSATISGTMLQDVTGNGLSPDDVPLAGVNVRLYQDLNANGELDASDGAAIASTVSAGDGAFAFTGLATGRFLVRDAYDGSTQIRTAPLFSSVIAVHVTDANGTYDDLVFANYVNTFDPTAISDISYTINGTTTVTSLQGNVEQGDTVTAHFTVAAGKTVELTLVSYTADPDSPLGYIQSQVLFDVDTGVFGAGEHSLTVDVPDCFFQLDFVGGKAIEPFGPTGTNIRYQAQDRRIDFANGGTHKCDCDEETGDEGLTPGFWKNHTDLWQEYSPNQTLESVFDVPNSLGLDNATLLEALNFGGGGGVLGAARNLFRHAVAALLNAAHEHVDYALTTSSIISQVNSALASNNKSTIEALKNQLDDFNNGDGGIDAHGNPT